MVSVNSLPLTLVLVVLGLVAHQVNGQGPGILASATASCIPGQNQFVNSFLIRNYDRGGALPLYKRWLVDCGRIPLGAMISSCYWTDFVNEYQGPIDFKCQREEVIVGIATSTSALSLDTKLQFQCCKAKDFYVYNCGNSVTIRDNDEITYEVPSGKVLTGLISNYHRESRTRDVRFRTCSIELPRQVFEDNGFGSVGNVHSLGPIGGTGGGNNRPFDDFDLKK